MPVLRQAALIALYLAALLLGLALFNADAENNWTAFAIWASTSLVLGFWLARWSAAVLPILVGIPMAMPFGYADKYLGSDAPMVWWFALIAAVVAVSAILVTASARKLYERGRPPLA